jgi:hypothetical protein
MERIDILKEYGQSIIDEMREFMDKKFKEQGRLGQASETDLYKNIKFEIKKDTIIFIFPQHIEYVNNGRKNFKGVIPKKSYVKTKYSKKDVKKILKRRPPVDSIEKWLTKKNLDLNKYAVSFGIARSGIPAVADDEKSLLTIAYMNNDRIQKMIEKYADKNIDEKLLALNFKNIKVKIS